MIEGKGEAALAHRIPTAVCQKSGIGRVSGGRVAAPSGEEQHSAPTHVESNSSGPIVVVL
jgi:hypothetical protein